MQDEPLTVKRIYLEFDADLIGSAKPLSNFLPGLRTLPMSTYRIVRLSAFIREHRESILQTWEDFARTIEPPALSMDSKELRNHAGQMLEAIAADLDTSQTPFEQSEKSMGRGKVSAGDSAAETHAIARLLSGYSIEQLVSEYRALRASVLRLWAAASKESLVTDPVDVIRFNESIDQALAESVKRYAKLVKQAQNLFLAILGHDLRNPLGTTISGANLLMLATDIDTRHKAIATSIFNSGERMGKLVDDLIDYTRTHLGHGIPVAPKPTNVAQLCNQVIDEMRILHPGRTIEFNTEGNLDCVWDADRIAQVLSNLIGNAFQHGSPSDAVILKAYSNETDVMISVNNQGQIIPGDRIQSIFDPLVRFSEFESTGTKSDTSLGIGLFISREVAMAHGGVIDVTSSSEAGTTFVLHLPRISCTGSAVKGPQTLDTVE
jgi:signal transduction histidine kinase